MKTLKRILSASKCKLLLRHASAILGMATLLCVSSYNVQAQKVKNLGKVSAFQQLLSSEDPQLKSTRKEASKIFKIATTGSSLSAYINVHTRQGATEGFIGSVEGSPSATVYFNFKDGKVDGKAILIKEKKAFVYTTNAKGEVEVQQQPLDKAICTEYPIKSSKGVVHTSIAPAPPAGSTAYTLESLPGAQAVLMLDFDGEYVVNTRWNGGAVIDAQPTDYTEAEITGIWQLVSEDFRVFNVNVTTNNTVFLAADRFRRMKCIFTPTNQINPLWGGVAYPYSFFVDNDDPCWVFNYGVKPAAETASHELGHTFGLSHDGRSNPAEDYYSGTANWAPIMGNSMYSQPSHWSLGEYANANNLEDDIDMIANYPISGTTSGVGFRTDEAGNTLATAKLLVYDGAGDISPSQNVGIITTRTDVDIYYFNSTGGTASINLSATM
ncbi:MAG TPA: hypothetical protein VL947_10625, partial [Cytophagales bacterium]|nr:hypothetical protein [Cytophagales bacterium]